MSWKLKGNFQKILVNQTVVFNKDGDKNSKKYINWKLHFRHFEMFKVLPPPRLDLLLPVPHSLLKHVIEAFLRHLDQYTLYSIYDLLSVYKITTFKFLLHLMITWPAYCWQDQPSYRSYYLQNSISYPKDLYYILLLSVMPVDVGQKKDNAIRLIGSWDLGVLFQKVLPAGHNSGRVIIKEKIKITRTYVGL